MAQETFPQNTFYDTEARILERLIERHYGVSYDIIAENNWPSGSYQVVGDVHENELPCLYVNQWKAEGIVPNIDEILNDLCALGIIPDGHYLIEL